MPDLYEIIDAIARLNGTLPDGTRSVVALVLISAVWSSWSPPRSLVSAAL